MAKRLNLTRGTLFWVLASSFDAVEHTPHTFAQWQKAFVELAPGKESLAHRLAYEAHTEGSIPAGMCVLHACDNPPCCNPAHLFLGTRAENAADRDAKKRYQHGENHYAAKLAEAQVAELRARFAKGETVKDLAADYGIAYKHAWKIANNKIWKDT